MTQSINRLDKLVEDYLGAVSYACTTAGVPPDRRDDLVADLREHIAAARAVLYQQTEAAVRTIIDRLGEPAAIAAEARLADPFETGAAPTPAKPDRAKPPNRWLSRPMSPVTFAILVGFTFVLITMMVLMTIMALREGNPPPLR
ncbi:MAG TPA: hypothetical protein VGR06_11705 [Actinophytocola sp.]|jgi:uncharacterized membrane protein|uniref:HAAS signaling domain-containing protein n=1 Tax=Actinophytocola sp. TaxID=1872138 RepID=UPI002DFBA8CB|nr:hypothetical protein [Actinophytocola sp.]